GIETRQTVQNVKKVDSFLKLSTFSKHIAGMIFRTIDAQVRVKRQLAVWNRNKSLTPSNRTTFRHNRVQKIALETVVDRVAGERSTVVKRSISRSLSQS